MKDQLVLKEIVHQRLAQPNVKGRLACWLHSSQGVEQQHHDEVVLDVSWRKRLGHWRCTISFAPQNEHVFAQVDIHEDGDVRIESYQPCSITVSSENNLLCVTRIRA